MVDWTKFKPVEPVAEKPSVDWTKFKPVEARPAITRPVMALNSEGTRAKLGSAIANKIASDPKEMARLQEAAQRQGVRPAELLRQIGAKRAAELPDADYGQLDPLNILDESRMLNRYQAAKSGKPFSGARYGQEDTFYAGSQNVEDMDRVAASLVERFGPEVQGQRASQTIKNVREKYYSDLKPDEFARSLGLRGHENSKDADTKPMGLGPATVEAFKAGAAAPVAGTVRAYGDIAGDRAAQQNADYANAAIGEASQDARLGRSGVGKLVVDTAQSAPLMLATGATGRVLGTGAALAGMGAGAGLQKYGQNRSEGYGVGESAASAALTGAAEAGSELLPISKALAPAKGFAGQIGRLAETSLAEAATEPYSQIGEAVGDALLGKKVDVGQQVQDAAYSALVGGVSGGGLAVPSMAVDAARKLAAFEAAKKAAIAETGKTEPTIDDLRALTRKALHSDKIRQMEAAREVAPTPEAKGTLDAQIELEKAQADVDTRNAIKPVAPQGNIAPQNVAPDDNAALAALLEKVDNGRPEVAHVQRPNVSDAAGNPSALPRQSGVQPDVQPPVATRPARDIQRNGQGMADAVAGVAEDANLAPPVALNPQPEAPLDGSVETVAGTPAGREGVSRPAAAIPQAAQPEAAVDGGPLSRLSRVVLQRAGETRAGMGLLLSQMDDADAIAIREAGVAEIDDNGNEVVYPHALQGERDRRYAAEMAAIERSASKPGYGAEGAEQRAQFYDQLANEQDNELGDAQKVAEYRAKAAAIRARINAKPLDSASGETAPQVRLDTGSVGAVSGVAGESGETTARGQVDDQARQAGVPAAVPTSAAGEVVEAPVGRRTGELARDSGEGLEVRGAPAAVTAELTNNGPNSGTSVPNVGTVEPDSLDVPPAPRDFKQAVLTLRNEIGWADRGGRLIRTPEGSGYDGGDAVGRTAWVPKSPFWGGRPGVAERSAVTEAEAARAFDKYENGKHLSPKELRFIQYAESYERDYNEQGQEIDALSKEQSAQESRDEILSLRDAEIAEARANRGNRGNTERARLESAIDADLSTLTDAEVRQLAADLQQGIVTSYVGGRPIEGVENLVGYERRKRQGQAKPHMAFIDGDGFKAINDTYGHDVGDSVIHAMAESLTAQAPGAVVHRSGDEFFVESDDPAALETAMKAAQDTLAAKTFTFIGPNGETTSFSNIGFSYGIAQDPNSAEAALHADKDRRKAAGLRTGRRATDVAAGSDRPAPVQAGANRREVSVPASRGGSSQGITVAEAEKAAAARFGPRLIRRLSSVGALRIVDSAEAKRVHPELPDDATGFQKDGVGYVIADRATAEEIPGLVLHEVAGHYGLPKMLGDEWPALLRRMERLKAGDKDVASAFAGVHPETPKADVTEEALANLIQASPDHGIVRRIVEGIKRFLNRIGIPMSLVESTDVAEIRKLALDALEYAASGKAGKRKGPVRHHKAYHGSPHDFDKFSLDKIGTGEGAQAYGHGLYFAGKRGVAEHYKKVLATDRFVTKDGEAWSPDSLKHMNVRTAGRRNGTDLDATIARANELLAGANDQTRPMLESDIAELTRLKGKGGITEHGGRLYEVELAPKEDEYLDWDKPLSEQSEKVRAASKRLWGALPEWYREEVSDRLNADFDEMTGQELYRAVTKQASEGLQSEYAHPAETERSVRADEIASYALHKAGIPGIRYKDATARGTDQESHNYVIFDDSLVKVEAKYSRRVPKNDQTETEDLKSGSTDIDALSNDKPSNVGDGRLAEGPARWRANKAAFTEGSRVKGVVYHGTNADIEVFDTKRGDLGTHFGTIEQANKSVARGRGAGAGPNVIPAYISLKNPLRLRDTGTFHADGIAPQLAQKGWITRAEAKQIVDEIERNWRLREKYDEQLLNLIKEHGHDGVVYANTTEGKGDSYIVFEPTQIKSAIGNNGDFNPADPRILYSRRAPQQAQAQASQNRAQATQDTGATGPLTWTYEDRFEGAKGKLHALREGIQDKMLSILDAQEQIEAVRGVLEDSSSLYRRENLMHGRIGDGILKIERNHAKPLFDAMRREKVSQEEFETYLANRHAEERNKAIAAINDKMPDGGSGISTADAKAYLAGVSPEQRAKMERLAKRVDAITKETRTRLRDSGIISDAQLQAMEAQYQSYVPLRGKEGVEAGYRTGGGIDVRGQPIKRALGRGEGNLASNILAEIFKDAELSVIQAEKARVGQTALKLALENPNEDIWTVEPVETERKFSDATGQVYEAIKNLDNDPGMLMVPFRGKRYRLQFHDPRMAGAIKNLSAEQIHGVFRFLGALNRYFSAVLTRYNPSFVSVNMLRDAIQGFTGIAGEHGMKTAAKVAANYFPAMRGLWRDQRGKTQGTNWQALARDFAEQGGKTSFGKFENVQEINARIGLEFKRFSQLVSEGRPISAIRKALLDSAIIKGIEDANDVVENTIRLATYGTLVEQGMSKEKAAEYAKNLTVNFNRRGAWGSALNAMFLFFNAATQGTHRTFRLLKNKKVLAAMGAMAGLQALMAFLAMGMKDDDDEQSLWEKIPDYEKQRNLIFVIPHQREDGSLGGAVFKVPMPYGLSLFPYLGGRATQFASNLAQGKEAKTGEFVTDATVGMSQAFAPLPFDDGWSAAKPQILKVFDAIAQNKDDLGMRIRNDNPYAKYDMPRAAMGKDSTPEIFRAAAKGLNRLGGGDDFTPPMAKFLLDWAPEDLQYLAETFTGGIGSTVTRAGGGIERVLAGVPVTTNDFPIIRSLVGEVDDKRATAGLYYDTREEIERDLARIRAAVKEGKPAPETKYIRAGTYTVKRDKDGDVTVKALPGSTLQTYRDAEKALSALNDRIGETYRTASALERRRQIEKLQKEREQIQRRLNRAATR